MEDIIISKMNVEYIVANPTGNITVLVTTPVSKEDKLAVVKEMFENTPTCEQVGFVRVESDNRIALEMMGGEFCGNATISAAAYLISLHNPQIGSQAVATVDASGADKPISVLVKYLGDSLYTGTLEMPLPSMSYYDGCPVVNLDGISHMFIPAGTTTADELENSIKSIAVDMGVDALGIIQYEEDDEGMTIVPLVHVRGSDTLVWEQGCGSGSIAAAYLRYMKDNSNRVTAVTQPGGVITVEIKDDCVVITGNVTLGDR